MRKKVLSASRAIQLLRKEGRKEKFQYFARKVDNEERKDVSVP